jgi:hypothetical protein
VAWVALDHHVCRLEERVGDLGDGELLVVRLLGADDGRVRADREVNPRVRDEVGLELGEIDVECAVKPQRRSQRRHDLPDEAVQVHVGWALNVKRAAAGIVQRLVVDHECVVRVVDQRMRRENGVVRLDDGC